jgi:glutamate-1-semialdehyde 2,1-aminomutase
MPTPHPVSLAAAEAVLSILKNETTYERIEERALQLTSGIEALAGRFARPMTVNRLGSVFALYMTSEPVTDCLAARRSDDTAYWRFAEALRREGVLLPRQPGGTAFLSSAHGAKDVEETLAACERVLLRLHQEDQP